MTQKVAFLDNELVGHSRRKIREMSQQDFIEHCGSGTLRKSYQLGFDIQEAYLQERAKFEFGEGFEIIQRSRVTYSDIKLVKSQAMTELGWHAERMIMTKAFDSDQFVCKQFEIEYAEGRIKHGIGILVKESSAQWIPNGYMVFAIVAERMNGQYLNAINPF